MLLIAQQLSKRKRRYQALRASDARAKVTFRLERVLVFRSIAPLKKFSLLMRAGKFLLCGPKLQCQIMFNIIKFSIMLDEIRKFLIFGIFDI